jgi:hypothetical protein
MNKFFKITAFSAATLCVFGAGAAHAQQPTGKLSVEERSRLEARIAMEASVNRDIQDRARALDNAYRAAKAADAVIGAAANRVPGGAAAYKVGKAVGAVGSAVVANQKSRKR